MNELQQTFQVKEIQLLDDLAALCRMYNLTVSQLHSKWESFAIGLEQRDNKENSDYAQLNAETLNEFKAELRLKIASKAQQQTPQQGLKSRTGKKLSLGGGLLPIPQFAATPLQPVSLTPNNLNGSQNENFSQRQNKGKVEVVFNAHLQVQVDQKPTLKPRVVIAQHPDFVYEPYRFMNDKPVDVAHAVDLRLNQVGALIADHDGFLDQVANPAVASQYTVKSLGRIVSEGGQRLDDKSVLLETSRQVGGGKILRLNLNGLSDFSIFPGQIVGVEGLNNTGQDIFTATSIYNAPPPDGAISKISQLKEYSYGAKYTNGSQIRIVAVAGPYQFAGSWQFECFQELMASLESNIPDVLILIGPFIDDRNTDLVEGRTSSSELELFITNFSEPLVKFLSDHISAQVVLVPSMHDALHQWCAFPQAGFRKGILFPMLGERTGKSVSSRLHCVANPSIFAINEIHFGIASHDVLFDMVSEELNRYSQEQKQDHVSRMVEHCLSQRSFYPLDPPNESVYLCRTQQEAYSLPLKPDVLLLPSKMATFVKNVQGCMVINPGLLCKNSSGGTFAQFLIDPVQEEDLLAAAQSEIEQADYEDQYMYHGVVDRTRVSVVRI